MMKVLAGVPMQKRKSDPFLSIKEDNGEWRRVVLKEAEFPYTIGRARDCRLVFDHHEVSRLHARLEYAHEQVMLVDLGSTNGTFVNQERLMPHEPHRLRAGDRITLGTICTMDFEDPATTATIPVVQATLPGLRLDEASASVMLDGLRIDPPLSPGQFALLRLLHDHEATVITRDEVRDRVWGPGQEVSDQTLDALVSRLRRRLAQADPTHEYIVTRRGFGLMFRNKR